MEITEAKLKEIETIVKSRTDAMITRYLAGIEKHKEAYVNALPDDYDWLQDFIEWMEIADWD